MKIYDHKKIEKKWQKEWLKSGIYNAKNASSKKKFYGLIEFPYPSGDGLHVGHPRPYIGMDIISRKRRMEGYNVLYPIGWDAFGLPTENFAIKTGIHPKIVTKRNTDTFRRQIQSLGVSFDWSREINTTDPAYYKWTQWIFLQMYKKGLAYKSKTAINWCLSCKIGLANEEVIDGKCERCGGMTEKREKDQWMLAITKYADRLDGDLDQVDYLPRIKTQQRNWIGKSEGSEIDFIIKDNDLKITVFTTRADTLFGVTYVVLAPEHPEIVNLRSVIKNWKEVESYIQKTKKKTDIERTAEGKEKHGVELDGVFAVNPANGEEVPVWVADYVLPQYGTGAIMAVPSHDERDFAFAEKYGLEKKCVIEPSKDALGPDEHMSLDSLTEFLTKVIQGEACYLGEKGKLINSGKFSNMLSHEARVAITKHVGGRVVTKFKLRDWVFSRQRYWGEPIPMIHCEKCGWQAVPDKDLPVKLPEVKSYKPTDSGESPLSEIKSWVNTKCPKCKGKAKRETDTMPNWAGSSWYFLRYTDTKNKKEFASKKNLKYWTPIDWYNGGMEHTTLHLLYSRFWHKFLYDMKLVPTSEPYMKRTSHGFILAEGGEKMSKSRGNVVNPDEMVSMYGADTLRMYEMFIGPFDQTAVWSTESIVGCRRFIEKVWKISDKISKTKHTQTNPQILRVLNKTIKQVGEDIEKMGFNTAVSAMMMCANEMEKAEVISKKDFLKLVKVFSVFAPHISEEIWKDLGEKKSIHIATWPEYDSKLLISDTTVIGIQVNGKVRAEIEVSNTESEEDVKSKVVKLDKLAPWLQGKNIKRVIYIKGKIISIVV
jgi:leucyl-tRNA synthetase